MPRRAPKVRLDDLSVRRHVEPKTIELHQRAFDSFEIWLSVNLTGLVISTLVHAPSVCDALVAEFGRQDRNPVNLTRPTQPMRLVHYALQLPLIDVRVLSV